LAIIFIAFQAGKEYTGAVQETLSLKPLLKLTIVTLEGVILAYSLSMVKPPDENKLPFTWLIVYLASILIFLKLEILFEKVKRVLNDTLAPFYTYGLSRQVVSDGPLEQMLHGSPLLLPKSSSCLEMTLIRRQKICLANHAFAAA
jgi:hypothetical protein